MVAREPDPTPDPTVAPLAPIHVGLAVDRRVESARNLLGGIARNADPARRGRRSVELLGLHRPDPSDARDVHGVRWPLGRVHRGPLRLVPDAEPAEGRTAHHLHRAGADDVPSSAAPMTVPHGLGPLERG